jgi:anaerobic ribonucleoside-triphosphate reductase activating protein
MRYAQLRRYDISNGPNIRATLFVSGCTHNCKGCFNKDYQDFNYGKEWTSITETLFLCYAKDPKVKGINILGGEPLQQTMDNSLADLLAKIKENTNKPIWLWTGYKLEDVINNTKVMNILQYVDVLIDGKFEEDKKDLNLMYRGSANQRIINLTKTFEKGEIVLL